MTPALTTIILETAAKHGVRVSDILKHDRLRPYVHARQEAMYRARTELQLSFPQLGLAFARDHTTVQHACRAHSLRDTVAFRAMNLRAFAGAL